MWGPVRQTSSGFSQGLSGRFNHGLGAESKFPEQVCCRRRCAETVDADDLPAIADKLVTVQADPGIDSHARGHSGWQKLVAIALILGQKQLRIGYGHNP